MNLETRTDPDQIKPPRDGRPDGPPAGSPLTPPNGREMLVAAISLLFIALWPIYVADKGFDLTDTGYYLAHYKYALGPDNINSLLTVFSNIIGHAIFISAGDGQLYLLKLVCVGLYAVVALLAFLVLRNHFPSWLILPALACSSVLATTYMYVTSYNTLSYFFLMISIWLLHRGLKRESPLPVMASAALLAFNIFIRVPNVLQLALVMAPLWHFGVCQNRWKTAWRFTFLFVAALLAAGLASVLAALWILGPETIEATLNYLFSTLTDIGDGHSVDSFMMMYLKSLSVGVHLWLLYINSLILLALIRVYLLSRLDLSSTALNLLSLLGGLAVLTSLHNYAMADSEGGRDFLTSFYAAGIIVPLAGLIYYRRKNPLLSSFSLMLMVVLLAMPFGSDYSCRHYTFFTHLIAAGTAGLIYLLWSDLAESLSGIFRLAYGRTASHPPAGAASGNLVLLFVIGILFLQLTDPRLHGAFLSAPYRQSNTAVEGVPLLKGMKTEASRAQMIEKLYQVTRPFTDLELAQTGHCPLSLTISGLKPYFREPWTDLRYFTAMDMEAELDQAGHERRWPLVIVFENFEPGRRPGWVDNIKSTLLHDFAKKNGYILVAEHHYFTVYRPRPDGQATPVQPEE